MSAETIIMQVSGVRKHYLRSLRSSQHPKI